MACYVLQRWSAGKDHADNHSCIQEVRTNGMTFWAYVHEEPQLNVRTLDTRRWCVVLGLPAWTSAILHTNSWQADEQAVDIGASKS